VDTSGTNRLDTVRIKAQQWADELIDFGRYNTLLHYRDSKTSTLDLTNSQTDSLTQFLDGRKTRLSALLPERESHATACIRARNLRRTMLMYAEEQGIEVGRLAHGLFRVTPPTTRGTSPVLPLRAPLLLQPIVVEPRTAAENDYTVDLAGDAEVNPVLLYALHRQYGVDFDLASTVEQLNAQLGEIGSLAAKAEEAYQVLADLVGRQGLSTELEQRILAGIFSFEKLPMVEDLRSSAELLAQHDVVAAAAGCTPAIETLQTQAAEYQPIRPDDVAPHDEFLVLDADASQHKVILAVLDGQHVVIQGPPGTGKSQTIANIIASAAASGKRILFVTEKRAAIEAVTERLEKVDLHHLVFDLHGQKLSKRQVAEQVAESLKRASTELPPPINGLHQHLAERRRQVIRHSDEVHRKRGPWDLSAFDVYQALLDLPKRGQNLIRFRDVRLGALDNKIVRDVENDLNQFVNMGGLAVRRGDSAWSRCEIRDAEAAGEVLAKLDALAGEVWRDAQSEMTALVSKAGLARPFDFVGWQDILGLLSSVEWTVSRYGESIFEAQLDDLCYATGDRQWRAEHPRPLGAGKRFVLRRRAAAMRQDGKCDRRTLHSELVAASVQLYRWGQLAVDEGGPVAVVGLASAMERFTDVRDHLAAVALCARLEDPDHWPEDKLTSTLAQLRTDQETLFRMPELNTITDRLEALGLGPLLDELVRRDADANEALEVLRFSWYSSLLDEYRLRVPYLANFSGREHSRIVEEFKKADIDHLTLNAQRVRRKVAERLRVVRDANKAQNTVVLAEANRKRGHMPIRKLVTRAPDVLLAARPCWAMSPVVVSRLLPAERLFDLVIFDEASQVEPFDAMASIMRGSQLVVAGDEHQLPPSRFFRNMARGGVGDDDDDADEEQMPVAPKLGDFESILKCLATFVPQSHTLTWHYRSYDERLIAFSNEEIYKRDLVTFPSCNVDSPLRLEAVEGSARLGSGGVVGAEVQRVVELVLQHVREHPDDTLGVITMGSKHANHVEAALYAATSEHQELEEFTARMQGPGRRLFVKSLENVQGDERDAIILSMGYSKGPDGRLRMQFGPINQEGGERRLNVAVTRARRRMCVVSSFTHHDMPPDWPTVGPKLLRRFLEFASNGGRMDEVGKAVATEPNGFERSVAEALDAHQVQYVREWGVSGYRIDFALIHPDQPGRMILAVEADGDSYHRSPSARDRDRLRQEHLERLGWRFHRVWASEWFSDPHAQSARIVDRWRDASTDADREALTKPSAEPPAVPSPRPAPTTVPDIPDVVARRGPRPPVPRRRIDEYDSEEIVNICRWLLRDGLLLDRDTRIDQAVEQLGFQRRGSKIVQRINTALDRAERTSESEQV
jgi:very-short-patch-repair endonuclease